MSSSAVVSGYLNDIFCCYDLASDIRCLMRYVWFQLKEGRKRGEGKYRRWRRQRLSWCYKMPRCHGVTRPGVMVLQDQVPWCYKTPGVMVLQEPGVVLQDSCSKPHLKSIQGWNHNLRDFLLHHNVSTCSCVCTLINYTATIYCRSSNSASLILGQKSI